MVSLAALLVAAASAAHAEPTRVDVRVISKGAKFVGSSLGGAEVTIRNVATGEVMAKGVTAGTTGDTNRIMRKEQRRHSPVSTPDAAVFRTELDVDGPTRIEIVAEGPLAYPRSMSRVSVTQWLVPGKHVTGGDGVVLELPGFVVAVLEPLPDQKLVGVPQKVRLTVHVAMMCGCPIEPGGIWDAEKLEVVAMLTRDGAPAERVPLRYAGSTSRFEASVELDAAAEWDVTVYAYDPANGNTGVDRTKIVVEP